ncbi:MAG: methionine/alanine import family NSS transporter small subunit [Desulfobacteraceae bacterium]|nr:methionine/alanine import family NSS transporter small subunit [Desulfobacteraceae bacterium]
MTTSAIIMMVLGLGLTWGGVVVCITIALRKKNRT